MSANAMEAQQRLQAASAAYQQAQAQLQDIVDARGRLGAQLSENEAVHEVRPPLHPISYISPDEPQEFKSLTPQNEIYKLVGPVLVKQDAADARSNVDKRLEFIRSEMHVPARCPPIRAI
jgi:prefoldin beta subunit